MPTFKATKELARYIDPSNRQKTRRAKPPAFMEDAKKDGLSVNSLEVETANQIAAIYAATFGEERPVALSTPTIEDYNLAAREAGLAITGYQDDAPHWTFPGPSGPAEASYVHQPKPHNESHCLVRYTRCWKDDETEFRFAVRMARKPTFKMV